MTKTKTNSVDVFDIDPVAACEAGADIELLHPATAQPLGVFLRVLGGESKEFTTLARKKIKASTLKGLNTKGEDRKPEDAAEEIVENVFSKADTIELATACTVGWWHFADIEKREGRVDSLTFGGEEIAFSKDAARKVFTDRPWIAKQAENGIGDLKRFMMG